MKSSGWFSILRIAVSTLMLGLWLGTVALAVSPGLHHLLHHDSQNPAHECLATLLGKSHVLPGLGGGATIILILVFTGLRLCAESSTFPAVDYRLSPSRAPPSAVPLTVVVG